MKELRALAFYLPQFHPIKENDDWWGKGFTEWRNVAKATPLFPGHHQPHLPADLGFYDLRLPQAREAQATMAQAYGIDGFCYYHYWFNGRRILERPFNEVLDSGKPDMPFCLCWANENWTRVWDGGESHVLLEQKYGHSDDLAHIQSLIPAFRDERYVRVGGKPMFLVYRTGILPNAKRTAEIWRQAAHDAGLEGLYLVRVESHADDSDPRLIGFDASVEFAPFNGLHTRLFVSELCRVLGELGMLPQGLLAHKYFRYEEVAQLMASRHAPAFKRFRCVTPGWDNSARRQSNGTVLLGSTPEIYGHWLEKVVSQTIHEHAPDERLVFINAWNEWAEGNHLEPDAKWGLQYLEATRRAIASGLARSIDPQSVLGSAQPKAGIGVRTKVSERLRKSMTLHDLSYVTLPRPWQKP